MTAAGPTCDWIRVTLGPLFVRAPVFGAFAAVLASITMLIRSATER